MFVFDVILLVLLKLCCFLLGESGLGKSTLINSLFLTELYSPEYPGPSHRIKKTVQVCLGKKRYSLNIVTCNLVM